MRNLSEKKIIDNLHIILETRLFRDPNSNASDERKQLMKYFGQENLQ